MLQVTSYAFKERGKVNSVRIKAVLVFLLFEACKFYLEKNFLVLKECVV